MKPSTKDSYEIKGDYNLSSLSSLEQKFLEVFEKAKTLPEQGVLTVKIEVNYLASHAKQQLFFFAKELAEHNLNIVNHKIDVEWIYDYDDEDIEELGVMFQDVFIEKGLSDRFRLVANH